MPGLFLFLWFCSTAFAANLPEGFTETQIATGLTYPTAMSLTPDGRIFVCEQGGQLRVVKDGALLATPFLTVTVDGAGERGLVGVAVDPNFNSNHFIYVYYTALTPAPHNRLSRFTANGDVALAHSEVALLDLDNLGPAKIHNGGALRFGNDGRLYIGVGDNSVPPNAQSFSNLLGKILRLNADGSIPADNPFFNSATGNNRAIWALGFRNPFSFAVQRTTGRIFVEDVGQDTWEEIDEGVSGSNYGWPLVEGFTSDPRFRSPLFQYGHGVGETLGCAITGGAFYNPSANQFPSEFVGQFFFADYCNGWIRRLDPANGNLVSGFAAGISFPVDLQVDDNGSLFYLARGNNTIYRIDYTGSPAPAVTTQPVSQLVSAGQTATFSITASGKQPLTYQWQRNSVDISGANLATYTFTANAGDNGANFRCVVSNTFGNATSNNAVLTVTNNKPPLATITAPVENSPYSGGDTISFSATGTDFEDGDLPASAFTWEVHFHHETHFHPFMPATSGIKSGSFVIPTTGETSAHVWYRIILTVTDSGGLTQTSYHDVLPRKSVTTVQSSPAGLTITLDGQPMIAPFSFEGVVGITRTLSAASPQALRGADYTFSSWTDNGTATHNISTPAESSVFTASFTPQTGSGRSVIQFTQPTYQVNEDTGHLTVTVGRSGETSVAADVDYASSNGTALDNADYTIASGTLHFAAGATARSFEVLITDDAYVEGNETVVLQLLNPSPNVDLGSQTTATLTITDNDTQASPLQPADDARFFVRQHYHDFLNREPDQGGWDYWASQITQCGNDADCIRRRRIGVSAAFFVEQEFQITGFFVYRLYRASFARVPSYNEFMFDRGNLAAGPNLEASKNTLLADWLQRPEFRQTYPDSMSAAQFVDVLLANVLQASGANLSSQRDKLIQDYNTLGRTFVLREVIDDATFTAAEYNSAFVLMQYLGYLRRSPDVEGFRFWLEILGHLPPGSQAYLNMVCAFLTSNEYQDRFNAVYTHHDNECGP